MFKVFMVALNLLLFSLSLYTQQMEDWQVLHTSNSIPSQFKVIDSNHYGYVDGSTSQSGTANGFYFTKNNWKDVFKSIDFREKDSVTPIVQDWDYINKDYIFLLVDSAYYKGFDGLNIVRDFRSFVYKSTDNGKTWEIISINNKKRSRWSSRLSMADSLNGLLIKYPSQYEPEETTDIIYKTTDGWKTCTKINAHHKMIGTSNLKLFPPSTIVARTLSNNIFISYDFGTTWENKVIPSDIILNGIDKNDFHIYNDSTYFFLTSANTQNTLKPHSKIIKTSDSGDNWVTLYNKFEADSGVIDLSFVNDSTFYMSGLILRHTSNSCKNISELSNAFINNYELSLTNIKEINQNLKIALAGNNILGFYGNFTLIPPRFVEPAVKSNVPLDFILRWDGIDGANKYHLQIVERQGAPWDTIRPPVDFNQNLLVNDSSITGTYFKIPVVLPYKEYTCRIRSINSTQSSPWISKAFTTVNSSSIQDEKHSDDFLIFPNPVQNYLAIQLSNQSGKIEIFSILGEKLISVEILHARSENRIDVSNLRAGLYFIRVGDKVIKFLKI